MSKLPQCTPTEVIRALERAGFQYIRSQGSHRAYVKGKITITVAFHRRELKKGTLHGIVKLAGFTDEEFLDLL